MKVSSSSCLLIMESVFTKWEAKGCSSSKADTSYIAIIARAILSSPSLKCCLKDIYSFIAETFPDLPEKSPNSWKNSVRHNLSLNECFVKASRCENGKGNYWTIHPANLVDFLQGDFRRRKAKARIRISTVINQQSVQYRPCVQLMPYVQFPNLLCVQAPKEHPSAGSKEVGSPPSNRIEVSSGVEISDEDSCPGESEDTGSSTYSDCSDEGSEFEDSGIVFVGPEKMEDSFSCNLEEAEVVTEEMQYDETSSPPAKTLKAFSIDNILSHKRGQGRKTKEACSPSWDDRECT